jgi:hypothetical protein
VSLRAISESRLLEGSRCSEHLPLARAFTTQQDYGVQKKARRGYLSAEQASVLVHTGRHKILKTASKEQLDCWNEAEAFCAVVFVRVR